MPTSLITHDGRPTADGLLILRQAEGRDYFDGVIGRLDRLLSEFLELQNREIDQSGTDKL